MNKTDQRFAFIGMAIAAALTWYAYYSNSHPKAPRLDDLVYIVLFPPSIGLMATERASALSQAFIVTMVIAANGGWFAFLSAVGRKIFKRPTGAAL